MRIRLLTLSTLASVLLFSSGAAAQDDLQTADVRCLIVVIKAMSVMKDEEMKSATMAGAMYYMGRLDGRQPAFDLESAVVEQMTTMKSEDLSKEGQRCGGELQTRGKSLQEVGDSLTKKGF